MLFLNSLTIIDVLIFESFYITIAIFPLHIWACELIFGHLLWKYHNKRVWYYDDHLSLCNGYISIGYVIHWTVLGSVIYCYKNYPIGLFIN